MKHRSSTRLPDYDYTHPGAYSVTVVTYQRECLFGEILDGVMVLNDFGLIVAETWLWLPAHYPYVQIDAWCVMPNHFHGVLSIVDLDPRRGGSRPAPTGNDHSGFLHTDTDITETNIKIKPLGQLVGSFKTVSAKRINLVRHTPAVPVWQRNFYEHIVRDDNELTRIRAYIDANPVNWQADQENR